MTDKVYSKVKGIDSDALNQNKQIIDRMREASGVETEAALARILGIQPQGITGAKKNGIPDKWLVQISNEFSCTIKYLLSGESDDIDGTKGHDTGKVKENIPDYGQKYGDIGAKEWEILGKAYRILASDTEYKGTLLQNINALYDALSYRQEIEDLKIRIQILEKVNKSNSSKGIEEEDQNRSAI